MSNDPPPEASDTSVNPELAGLQRSFDAGDYARLRKDAATLERGAADQKVKDAAKALVARTEADPLAKGLLGLTLALLVFLSVYWITHDGPGSAPKPPPQLIERITDTPAPPAPKPAGS